jgi:hypothetical protein
MAIQVGGTTVISDTRVLSSVTGLKTVGGTSILGSGDIATGGSTAYGAVGTYVGGYVNAGVSVFVDNNATKAGSNILKYDGNSGAYGHSLNSGNQNAATTTSAGLSGTWRCMASFEQGSANYLWGSIWLRIS